jgi:DNA-binding MarR family transcriptional regulator
MIAFMQSSPAGKKAAAAPSPPALARQLLGFFRYAWATSDTDFLREVSELDLTFTQFKTLMLLAHEPDELSVKEISERLGISLPAASRAVDPLVRRRLVARKEDAEDRRVKRVALTTRGRTLVDRLVAARVSSFTTMLEEFSDGELRKLGGALDAALGRPEIKPFADSFQSRTKRTS